jgi:hypothetical protein
MSKEKTAKFANKAEAKEALTAAKESKKSAKQELKAFEKENELASGEDHSGDAKHGKRWSKLKKAVDSAEAKVTDIEGEMEGLKSAKVDRPSKYEYPADVVTALDKKKYRAKMRAAAKKADKGDATTTETKKSKKKAKAAEAETPVEAPKSSGKSATKKKKKAAQEAEVVED